MLTPINIDGRTAREGQPRFYFFLLPQGRPEATRYQHPAVVLAEGFAALGLPFVSNIDHWPPAPGALPMFRSDPSVDPYSCSAVFVTSDWLEEGRPIPARLFEGPNRPITVYLDHEDGSGIRSLRPGFPDFDVVLRSHFVRDTPYRPNFRPWAFGLSNRILEATEPGASPGEGDVDVRLQRALVSYRHTRIPHGVRMYMDDRFVAKLPSNLQPYHYVEDVDGLFEDAMSEHLWRITGRRHSSRYFTALRRSAASVCFGGYFITRRPRDERHPLSRLLKRAVKRFRLHTTRITQFDSWRFWESLAAGCATIQLDLEKYGVRLPVMPDNWTHYAGIDIDELDADLERLADADRLLAIGVAGRSWSLEHYSPIPTAQRFLSLVGLPAAAP